jgi:hypothetical protein
MGALSTRRAAPKGAGGPPAAGLKGGRLCVACSQLVWYAEGRQHPSQSRYGTKHLPSPISAAGMPRRKQGVPAAGLQSMLPWLTGGGRPCGGTGERGPFVCEPG